MQRTRMASGSASGVLSKLADAMRSIRDEAEAQAEAYRAATPTVESERRLWVVFGTVFVSLLCIRFLGSPDRPELFFSLVKTVAGDQSRAVIKALKSPIGERVHWASIRMLSYGVLPLMAAKLLLRVPPSEIGLRLRGTGKSARLYLAILVLMAPIVVAASFGEGFQKKYPYYHVAPSEALWPGFWLWELLYGAQFIALEFFFRGFMVLGLVPRLGFASVPAMMVPYMMVHYGKPLPEVFGSIVAGFALGCLSLKGRSVYGGALVHICVACGMDMLSLWHAGRL